MTTPDRSRRERLKKRRKRKENDRSKNKNKKKTKHMKGRNGECNIKVEKTGKCGENGKRNKKWGGKREKTSKR